MQRMLFLLLLGARVACASSYYVDCNYGSNGNPGTSVEAAWRTPLAVTLHSATPGFAAGERNDIKRNVYDRIVTAAIAFAVSALITLHDRFLPR
jgi:hypothetical protein